MRRLLKLVIGCLALGVVWGACPHEEDGLKNWDEASTWPSQLVPVEDQNVTIETGMKVLLNKSPPCLSSITIEAGASLIWGDVDGITLCVSYILIKGRFQIGSEDCRFTKKSNIQLIGESNSPLFVSGFGKKFIGVTAGGTIEIHGEEKPSWTKLIQTVPAATDTCGSVFSFEKSHFSSETSKGLYVAVFNLDGSLFDFGVFRTGENTNGEDLNFQTFLNSIPNDKILAVALQGDLGTGEWSAIYTALESAGGLTSSLIRDVTGREAYALITKTGHTDTTVERHVTNPRNKSSVETGYLVLNDNGLQFRVNSKVHHNTRMRKGVDFEVFTEEVASPCIKVNADVTKWRAGDNWSHYLASIGGINNIQFDKGYDFEEAYFDDLQTKGDKVVVASTDFDWKQTEEMTIRACTSCDVNEICFTEPFRFMHYGEVSFGVDERAEVGLLSRNIVIEGVIPQEGCDVNDAEDQVLCDRFGYDTFGGQTKILKDAAAAHIQGVELFHMGQQKNVGTYPLHFHMCDSVAGNWFRHNSIHHTTRCVTVHGTDDAEVSHNVCYRHLGHGMFLEDSAEQGNIFDSNLVIGTMHGSHIMSDMKKEWCTGLLKRFCDALSSFWITHPNNTFINNVAAGGENVGYWILASPLPLGQSRSRQEERGLVKKKFAMETKILAFRNNTAHSYKDRGMRIDAIISHGTMKDGVFVPENGIFIPGISHTPRVTPGDKKSALDKSHLHGFTAYKNMNQNIWTKGGIVIMNNFTLADASSGIIMASGKSGAYAEVSGSLFVGETDNVGLPEEPFGRSVPKITDEPLQGIQFYQGPGVVTNSFFNKYQTKTAGSVERYAGAISVKRRNPYPPKANSHVKGIKFGFCDETEGNWAFNGAPSKPHFGNKDGNRQITFRDVDGSVSGTAGTQFVPNTRFHTTPRCDFREHMNFAVCPYDYAKVIFSGDGALETLAKNYPMHLRRDDRPDDAFALEGEKGNNYLVIKEKSYTVYFNGTAPTLLKISAQNMERGDNLRLGLCYPKDVTSFSFSGGYANIGSRNPAISVDTIEQLDADTTGRAYFHDRSVGLLFVKLNSTTVRVDHEACPEFRCPSLKITRNGGSDDTTDCSTEAYDGKYNKPEDAAVNIPTASETCDKTTSEGFGAEVEEAFFPTTSSSLTCPTDPVYPGRGSTEHLGCFKDSFVRDLPYDYIRLIQSMSVDLCVERCYHRGYQFAALQGGTKCWCGNQYGGYGASTACTKKCTGDDSQTCGGSIENDVYTTGKQGPPALSNCHSDNSGVIIDGKCYYLTTGSYKYLEAQRECVKLGGNLATINSESVQFDVERYLRPKMVNAWFGLNDILTNGKYENMDGTVPGAYTNFMDDQGADTVIRGVVLRADRLYQWDDQSPFLTHNALCQLDSSQISTTVNCGHNNYGKQIDGGGCYAVVNSMANYREATYACYTRRGVLPDASDLASLADIQKHLYLFGKNMDYWTEKEGEVYTELEYNKLYNKDTTRSGNRNGVVCKIETLTASSPCSTGWIQNGDHCYLYTSTSANYNLYKKLCNQGDSKVLSIENESENTFVANTVMTAISPKLIYLGFVYNVSAGTFEWEDGTSSAYTNWRANEGDSNTAGGWCSTMMPWNSEWKNRKCKKGGAVMCKAPAGP